MSANILDLKEILLKMQDVWTSFQCKAIEGMPFNQFHFGYPQEVDDIHKKNLPLMVVNPPSSIASTNEIQLDQNVLTNTSFVLQIYDHFPSSMTGQPSINKADNFDNLEKCFYYWLENTIDAHGTKVQLSAGSLRIERSTTSSNDKLYSLQCSFTLNYFVRCFKLN